MEEFLTEFARGPPFQNTLSLWSILSRGKGWNWRDVISYREFVDFLERSQIKLLKAPYGHPLTRSLGDQVLTYTVKIDKNLIDLLRGYFSD